LAIPWAGEYRDGLLLEPEQEALAIVGLANVSEELILVPDAWLESIEIRLLKGSQSLPEFNEEERPDFPVLVEEALEARDVASAIAVVEWTPGGMIPPGRGVSATVRCSLRQPGEYLLYVWIRPGAFEGMMSPGDTRNGRLSSPPLPILVQRDIREDLRIKRDMRQATLLAGHDDAAALQILDRLLAIGVVDGELHRLRGLVFYRLGRIHEARIALENALRLYKEGRLVMPTTSSDLQIPWIESSLAAIARGEPLRP
jgi:hypothetical protein